MSSNLNKYLQEDNHEPTQPSYEQRMIDLTRECLKPYEPDINIHVERVLIRQTALLLEAEELLNWIGSAASQEISLGGLDESEILGEIEHKVEEFLRRPR